jgi:hypothetical protein
LLPKGVWRLTYAFGYGTFDTSHVATCPDVAPIECSQQVIPDHRHVVRMTLYHSELTAGYGLSATTLLLARLPYDVKDQHVRYTTLDGQPFVPPYGDIHHRTETLRGVSDAELMAVVSPAPGWLLGGGFTLPIGKTELNPLVLGRLGLKHEHIQFGTGTVDPRFLLGWSRTFGRVGVEALADARVPLYENRHGYKGPVTVQYKVGPGMAFGRAAVTLAWAGQYQSIARWSGEKDEGTGFHNGGVFLGLSLDLGKGFQAAPGVYREIFSHSLSGDTFHQGTTLSFAISRVFP